MPGRNQRVIMFGSLKRNYDEKNDAVSFKSYLIFDMNGYAIKEVHPEGGEFRGLRPENFIVGQQLLYTLGGDQKTNELLDALGHKFSKEKYEEYVETVKKIRREEEVRQKLAKKEKKARQAKRNKELGYNPRLDKAKEIGSNVGLGFAIAGGVYVGGYYPWKFTHDVVLEGYEMTNKSAFALGFATTIVNAVALGGYRLFNYTAVNTPHMLNHITNMQYMISHDPLMYVLAAMTVTPAITGGVRGIFEGIKLLKKSYNDRKRREEERIRLERVRQAFCPADSESYYNV
ncbi:MAG: hypothetical protein KGH61_04320 [Candidatus Micrarchaeota archaeon]|nr:hypothetical protein [Candidatus Micrarchaeota archaeon]